MGFFSLFNKVFKNSNKPEVDSSSEADYAKFMEELSEKMRNGQHVNVGLKGNKEKPEVEQEVYDYDVTLNSYEDDD